MSQILLELPDGYTQQLKAFAAIRQKSMEDIILDAVRNLIDGNVPQDLHGRKQWMSFAGMLDESEADELLDIIHKNRINKVLKIKF
jgi:hypothetical protein